MKTKLILLVSVFLLGFLNAPPPVSFADDHTWTGGGGYSNPWWNAGYNWSGSVAPQSGDSLIFPYAPSCPYSWDSNSGFYVTNMYIRGTGYYIGGGYQLNLSGNIYNEYGTNQYDLGTKLQANSMFDVY